MLKKYEMPDILDKEEKEYLSAVIKPFKNKVQYIRKYRSKLCANKLPYKLKKVEYIYIYIDSNFLGGGIMTLPEFNARAMYKGMELNKKYTLKDLGL